MLKRRFTLGRWGHEPGELERSGDGPANGPGLRSPAGEGRERGRFVSVVTSLSVVGLIMGLTAGSVALLPAQAASAAKPKVATPYIFAPANTVIGESSGTLNLQVTLSATSANPVSVNFSVPAGNCNNALSGTGSGTLTFTPGQTVKNIPLTVNQCNGHFLNSATLTLSGAVNGIIADPLTVIDVVGDNNLVSTPGLYIRGNTVDTGAGMAQVPVMLGGPTGQTSTSTVTVNYTTVNGSAVSGTDYSTTSGQLTFGPGQTEQSISVPITNRSSSAPSRSFTVVLSGPSNAEHRSVHGHGDHRSERRDDAIVALHLRTAAHGDRRG